MPSATSGFFIISSRVAFIGTGSAVSNRLSYAVSAYRYQVNFVKLKCMDESDPEWAGSDEEVTTWVVSRGVVATVPGGMAAPVRV